MYSTQLLWEQTYSKSNIHTWIMDEVLAESVFTNMFVKTVDLITTFISNRDTYYSSKYTRINTLSLHTPEDIAIQLFCTILSSKPTEPIQGVATMLGLNYHSNQLDAVKTGAELLAISESSGLYSILAHYDTTHEHDTAVIKSNYELNDSTLLKIHTSMYMPPMLCEPIPWTTAHKGGHLLHQSSCILGTNNDIKQYQSYDVLNKLQSIAWELIPTMLLEEESPKSTLNMNEPNDIRKAKQHNDRCLQSSLVYDMLLNDDNRFFFIWKYDKRGRIYSQGYDVNLQGSEYKKATIQFAHKELLQGV